MLKAQKKYYFLLIALMMGLCSLAVSYATSNTSDNSTQASADSDAYVALLAAQGKAKTADDAAEKTKDNEPSNPSQMDYLHRIADSTYGLLKAFNSYSLNWLQIYTATTSTELDASLVNYAKSSDINFNNQLAILNGGSLTIENKGGNTTEKIPSIYSSKKEDPTIYQSDYSPSADLNYVTLIMQNAKDAVISPEIKDNARYFVKNASGINIYHAPTPTGGNPATAKRYNTFYNTVNAIASYNAYVLSEHLADLLNNFKLSHTQAELKTRASDKDWLDHINTEQSIGVILRQILLFNSQTYVLLADSLETQKQLLAATAMTNALIIANSGFYEQTLLTAAK